MSQFALEVAAFVAKAKGNADLVVRKIALDMLQRIVMRSPVGNPELWAANAHAVRVNTSIATYNANLRENPGNRDKRGRLRRGLAMKAVQGGEKRARLTLPAGQDYRGGAFRGNWQVSIGVPTGAIDAIDPNGGPTIAKGRAVLEGYKAGGEIIFIANHLPYGYRLEYEAHSKQAPAGMVRITVAEFHQVVTQAVGELPK